MNVFIIVILFFVNCLFSQNKKEHLDVSNFDFLLGKWEIKNEKLKERLVGSKEWITFPAYAETKRTLGDIGIMDEFKTNHFGSEFVGLSIRILNPKTNEWTIYWADNMNPELKLTEQVTGKFINGVGEFYGSELHKGRKVKIRFLWKLISEDLAYWEQAYFDKKHDKWETNWKMSFNRIKQ